MTQFDLLTEIVKYKEGVNNWEQLITAVEAYSSASNNGKPFVSGSLPLLTECKDACTLYADKKGGSNYGEIFRAYQEGINWALNKVTSGNDR